MEWCQHWPHRPPWGPIHRNHVKCLASCPARSRCLITIGDSVGKDSASNAGDMGSIPGSGRSPGEGNGNPLQYSGLRNPTDRGAWRALVHGIARVGHHLVTKPPWWWQRWRLRRNRALQLEDKSLQQATQLPGCHWPGPLQLHTSTHQSIHRTNSAPYRSWAAETFWHMAGCLWEQKVKMHRDCSPATRGFLRVLLEVRFHLQRGHS